MTDTTNTDAIELELVRADALNTLGAEDYDAEDAWLMDSDDDKRWNIVKTKHDLGDGHTVYEVSDNVISDSYYAVVVDGKVYSNEEHKALRSEYDEDFLALERIREAIKYVANTPLNHFKLSADDVDGLTFNDLAGHLQSLAADFRDAEKKHAKAEIDGMTSEEVTASMQRAILRINKLLLPGGFEKQAEQDWIAAALALDQIVKERKS